jgi:translation initiation factor 1
LFDITNITKEKQRIKIEVIKRKFSKIITLIHGIEKEEELKEIGKEMKQKFACGGTIANKTIELQGNHKARAKEFLIKKGYNENLIDA